MKHVTVEYNKDFEVLIGNRFSQSAVMVLEPGKSEGAKITNMRIVISGFMYCREADWLLLTVRKLNLKVMHYY